MLPKAVLSWIGRAVGIVAVLATPLAARAAPPAETSSAPSTTRGAHHARSHAHGKAQKKATTTKRGAHHLEDAKLETRRAPRDDDASPEVKAEPVSNKRPPKPSLTPLPTVAAVTSTPLAQPIGTQVAKPKGKPFADKVLLELGHAPEPTHTPITSGARHAKEPGEPKEANEPGAAAAGKKGKHPAKTACLHSPVDVMRGTEQQAFPLTKCDGSAAPLAVEEMSILVRPGSAAKPEAPIADLAKKSGDEIAPGIRRIDSRLVERLQLVVDHFAKPAKTPKLFVVSGYRPSSKGSFHAMGRALDFRIDGVENTDLVAFCKTLPDTGCGFYPNSSFIHIDVRDSGAGHVAWIDASDPGEKPEYVASWPPPPSADEDDEDPVKLLAKMDELQILPPATHENDAKPGDLKPAAASLTKRADDE